MKMDKKLKKVKVIDKPLTYILIANDRDETEAKIKWLKLYNSRIGLLNKTSKIKDYEKH
jgi:hypothetical protein